MSTQKKSTPAQQIAEMQALTQGGAAWLLGVHAKTLRDRTDAPRNADGTYDAKALLGWHADQARTAALDDESLERVLVIAEHATDADDVDRQCTAARTMRALVSRHGDAPLIALAKSLVDRWSENDYEPPPPDPEVVRRQEEEELAWSELRIACVCEGCGRLRRGTRWVRTTAPKGFVAWNDVCPDCQRKA